MPASDAVGVMTPLREFFLLSSVITSFVDLLEGAGTAFVTGALAAVFAAAGGGSGAADGIVGAECFTFADAGAATVAGFDGPDAATGLAGAATGLVTGLFGFTGFAAGFTTLFAAGLAAVFATGLAAGFATGLAAFAAGFTVFTGFATAFAGFFAAVDFAAGFFAVLDIFFTALAFPAALPLATIFFAVLRVVFAISVHRCG